MSSLWTWHRTPSETPVHDPTSYWQPTSSGCAAQALTSVSLLLLSSKRKLGPTAVVHVEGIAGFGAVCVSVAENRTCGHKSVIEKRLIIFPRGTCLTCPNVSHLQTQRFTVWLLPFSLSDVRTVPRIWNLRWLSLRHRCLLFLMNSWIDAICTEHTFWVRTKRKQIS